MREGTKLVPIPSKVFATGGWRTGPCHPDGPADRNRLGPRIKGPQGPRRDQYRGLHWAGRTGTATTGRMYVAESTASPGLSRRNSWPWSVPLKPPVNIPSLAIPRAAKGEGPLKRVTDLGSATGGGDREMMGGGRVVAGRRRWLQDIGNVPDDRHETA